MELQNHNRFPGLKKFEDGLSYLPLTIIELIMPLLAAAGFLVLLYFTHLVQ